MTDRAETEDEPDGVVLLDGDGSIDDAAYLISRGVRPMALLGEVLDENLDEAMTELERCAQAVARHSGALAPIPFAVAGANGLRSVGYASHPWVVDAFKRAVNDCGFQDPQYHRIVGLLLGYSPVAIDAFEQRQDQRAQLVA